MTVTLSVMAFALAACGSKEETKTEKETTTVADAAAGEETTTAGEAADTEETTTAGEAADTEETTTEAEASSEAATITQEEAIELVKGEFGEDSEFSYIPADELEEKDGSQYYVIYVKMLNEAGTATTVTTYMVKTDGSKYFDKYAVDYAGEYVRTGEAGEVTFVVSEDGTFKMTTTGTVTQEVSGKYKPGITNSASVIKLLLYPNKNVVDGKEQEIEVTEAGSVVIEGDKLTLSMESQDTEFTKK
jgi:uncharacterized protein YcfL